MFFIRQLIACIVLQMMSCVALADNAVITRVVALANSNDTKKAAAPSARDARIRLAQEAGYWILREGEHIYLIARAFEKDEKKVTALADELLRENPSAIQNANRSRLFVGTKITLPTRYHLKSDAKEITATSIEKTVAKPERATPQQATAEVKPLTETNQITNAAKVLIAPKPAYRDQLINASISPDLDPADNEFTPPAGIRSTSIEYRVESRQDRRNDLSVPRTLEQGVLLRYQRETQDFGLLGVEALIRDFREQNQPRTSKNAGHFTLTQLAFPLSAAWSADNALGLVRTPANALISSSYRVVLPSPTLMGLASVMKSDNREYRFMLGRVGDLLGTAVQVFDLRRGVVSQFGVTETLSGNSTLAAHIIDLRRSESAPDHTSASVSFQRGAVGDNRVKLQAIADSYGRVGVWTDAELFAGRDRHRIGAYWLARDLRWGDAGVANDTAGAYWRADFRAGNRNTYAGVEWAITNLNEAISSGGSQSASAYGGMTLRLSRDLNIGGTISAQQTRSRPIGRDGRDTINGNVYASLRTSLGLTRVDVSAARVKISNNAIVGADNDFVNAGVLSQEWPLDRWLGGAYGLSTTYSDSNERNQGVLARRRASTLSARGPLLSEAYWDLSVALVSVKNTLLGQPKTEKNINANLGVNWPFARHWTFSSYFLLNSVDTSTSVITNQPLPFVREKRMQFSIRYDETRGTPLFNLGRATGKLGAGNIVGVIFFDENGDGTVQPNERGAAGILVLLDGRIPTTTDREGRFSFSSVRTGAHVLTISVERLPLPWGLADDEPTKRVEVPLRGEVSLTIPLAKNAP
jgi:hypothetical protein